MLSVKALLTKMLENYPTSSQLTLTRTENSYINATNFASLNARKYGNIVVFHANIQFSTNLPSNSSYVDIGKINGITLPYGLSTIIPGQTSAARILVSLTEQGNIRVYNGSGTAASGFFRGFLIGVTA